MSNGPLKGRMAAQGGCNPGSRPRACPFLRHVSGCYPLFFHGYFPMMRCGGLMVLCTQHASKSAPQSPPLQWILPTIWALCFTSQISYISWPPQHADMLCQTILNQRGKSEKLSGYKGDCPRKSQWVAAHKNLPHQAANADQGPVDQIPCAEGKKNSGRSKYIRQLYSVKDFSSKAAYTKCYKNSTLGVLRLWSMKIKTTKAVTKKSVLAKRPLACYPSCPSVPWGWQEGRANRS